MNSVTTRLQNLHLVFTGICEKLCSPLLLFIRLYWGWQFAQTGWGKLHNQAKIVEFFTSLNIPFPALNAHFVSGLEFFGGILLILGLFSRPVSLLLTGSMFVAYWTADREALSSIFSNPGKFYGADPYTFLAAAVLILAFGPGLFSLDAIFLKKPRSQQSNAGVPTYKKHDAVTG
jgi:putative oxidoreductase